MKRFNAVRSYNKINVLVNI